MVHRDQPLEPELVATARSIWLKITGVPAHIWEERFFRLVSQLVGTFISIDDSTRDKVRLDTARALITTSAKEIINTVVEVKVNGTMYNIRMLEESIISAPTQGSDPNSESQMLIKERASLRADAYREANALWNMGKQIGMTSTKKDGEIIQTLVEMEERDRCQCKENEKENTGAGVATVS